jgi:hypothetical protein
MGQESTNSSSRRYGAEEKEACNPTLIDGLAQANSEGRYVDASRAPVRLHGKLKTPILPAGGVRRASMLL